MTPTKKPILPKALAPSTSTSWAITQAAARNPHGQPRSRAMRIPLALLGGMLALHLRGMTLHVSSAVGLIALFGAAVQNCVIMLSALVRCRRSDLDLHQAIVQGASERLRPVLMTATVAIFGLLPASLAHGIGSDVQRPLATVIVGGLTGATVLTLLILPVLFLVMERRFGGDVLTLNR